MHNDLGWQLKNERGFCAKGLKDLSQVYIVFASLQNVSEENLNDVKSTLQKIPKSVTSLSVLHSGEGKGVGKNDYCKFKGYFPHEGIFTLPIRSPTSSF